MLYDNKFPHIWENIHMVLTCDGRAFCEMKISIYFDADADAGAGIKIEYFDA